MTVTRVQPGRDHLPGVEVSPEFCTALTDVSRLVYCQAVLTYLGLK
jgi:hypothetical protein